MERKNETKEREMRKTLFPSFRTREDIASYLSGNGKLWEKYMEMPEAFREKLMGYFLGQNGFSVTYDAIFKRLFDPYLLPQRLESLLSALFSEQVRIVEILPLEGTRMTEKGSFVIMDILVRLDNGTFANVEVQKIGYRFPIERNDCYGADVILRQYVRLKAQSGALFDFRQMQKVYCIVIMEQSTREFHQASHQYVHRRRMQFDSGIMKENSGLHQDCFVCLDLFRKNVRSVSDVRSELDAWLTFLSATDVETIVELAARFPLFKEMYQEMARYMDDPEMVMTTLSEELYIMDRNTERLMVNELQDEKETLQCEMIELQSKKEALQSEKEALQGQKEVLQSEKEALQGQKEALQRENVVLQKENMELRQELDELKSKMEALQSKMDKLLGVE